MHRLGEVQPCPMPTLLEYGWLLAIYSGHQALQEEFVEGHRYCCR